MKELGNKSGGWIKTKEETFLSNHLRWAHLKVTGSLNEIPRKVETSDGGLNLSLPIWVEALCHDPS